MPTTPAQFLANLQARKVDSPVRLNRYSLTIHVDDEWIILPIRDGFLDTTPLVGMGFFSDCTAEGIACTNDDHSHWAGEEDNTAPNGGFLCNDCNAPTHWDEAGDYRHDDPSAPACFLIPYSA